MAGMQLKRVPTDIQLPHFFEAPHQLRAQFARLIGAADPQRVALIPSVSYGMGIVANNLDLRPGQEVVVVAEQFPSNMYPWMRAVSSAGATLRQVDPPTAMEGRGAQWNQRLLEAIGPQTRMVSLAHVHWADGTRFDLKALRQRTREVGALLVVDGTQSVGALPLNVADIQPDALICAGYKWLMGPYSIGFAYFNEVFDGGIPLEENWKNRWGSDDFTALVHYQDRYQPGALRYDVGEASNFILIPMMQAALTAIETWGIAEVQDYCEALMASAWAPLQAAGYWVESPAYRGSHLFGLRLPASRDPKTLKEKMIRAGISVSFRGSAIRVSPHLYNDAADIERLVACLTED